MNPLTNMKNVLKLSEGDLKSGDKTSWHDMYKDSAWLFVGGLPYDLTEGDIICVFSQYGEIVNINLIRDKVTGKQKGFCFICYEDQRSTILAVDNLNGIKILGRTIRVDHVSDYKVPKENDKMDEETRRLQMEGCAPKPQLEKDMIKKETKQNETWNNDIRLPARLPIDNVNIKLETIKKESSETKNVKKMKKSKRDKKSKKKRNDSSSSNSTSSSSNESDNERNSENRCKNKSMEQQSRNRDRSRSRSRNRDRSRNRNRDRSRSRNRDYDKRLKNKVGNEKSKDWSSRRNDNRYDYEYKRRRSRS